MERCQVLLVSLHCLHGRPCFHILWHDDGGSHSECYSRNHLRFIFLRALQPLLRLLDRQTRVFTLPSFSFSFPHFSPLLLPISCVWKLFYDVMPTALTHLFCYWCSFLVLNQFAEHSAVVDLVLLAVSPVLDLQRPCQLPVRRCHLKDHSDWHWWTDEDNECIYQGPLWIWPKLSQVYWHWASRVERFLCLYFHPRNQETQLPKALRHVSGHSTCSIVFHSSTTFQVRVVASEISCVHNLLADSFCIVSLAGALVGKGCKHRRIWNFHREFSIGSVFYVTELELLESWIIQCESLLSNILHWSWGIYPRDEVNTTAIPPVSVSMSPEAASLVYRYLK